MFGLLRSRSHVEHVDDVNFKEKVLGSQVPVLVDFYADWCGPCKMLAPLLEEIANGNPNVKIVKVNVGESPELAARYQINSIPSLKVFKSGKVVAQHVGLADKRRLESMLSR
jgi:thioredoxin 1